MELRSRQSRRYIIKARRWLQHDSSRVARCSGVSRALSWMEVRVGRSERNRMHANCWVESCSQWQANGSRKSK